MLTSVTSGNERIGGYFHLVLMFYKKTSCDDLFNLTLLQMIKIIVDLEIN